MDSSYDTVISNSSNGGKNWSYPMRLNPNFVNFTADYPNLMFANGYYLITWENQGIIWGSPQDKLTKVIQIFLSLVMSGLLPSRTQGKDLFNSQLRKNWTYPQDLMTVVTPTYQT